MASVPVYTSEGKVGWQSELAYGGTTMTGANPHLADAYTDIPELREITPGEAETEEVEFTHLKSPKRRREFKAGFTDGGTAEAVGNARYLSNVLDAAQKFVLNERVSGNNTVRWWRLRIYDNVNVAPALIQTVYFSGYVSSAGLGPFTTDAPQDLSFSVRTTGDEVWDPLTA